MKCDELKSYTCGGWCCDKEAYPKKDVDEAIAELKDEFKNACLERDDNQVAIDEYAKENEELKAENESLRKAVSNWHDKYCNLQETIDRLECKLECVKADKDKELRATKHALLMARKAHAVAMFSYWDCHYIDNPNAVYRNRKSYWLRNRWLLILDKIIKKEKEYK